MSSESEYVCTLDQASIKKAKDELNENPKDRLAAVQALREWIEAQPHIKCEKLDTEMLLMFMRGAKFSQIKAREKFEKSLSSKFEYPKWFLDLDTFHPSVKKQIDAGLYLPLPKRSPEGCKIVLYRMGALKEVLKKVSADEVIRVEAMLMDILQRPEMDQVNGHVSIIDCTGLTAGSMTKFMNSETAKSDKALMEGTVGRFKDFHVYRPGLVMEGLMAFYKPFMPKKWLGRIRLHDTMESIYKQVPMECLPVEYLPDDYTGPNAGTIDEIIETFSNEILSQEVRDRILYRSSKAFTIDKSKKPADNVSEHFRKLNVD